MSLEERIKNGTTELQDYYRIALRDIEKIGRASCRERV